jgi:chaperonin GroEL
MNEIPKELYFDSVKLVNGIEQLAKAVKSTLGPSGQTVLIESPNHTHGITVTKDGVTVAKAVDLIDPVENLAVRMMKEAADRTASEAGDGTTTSIVLAEALVKGGIELDDAKKTDVLRELKSLTDGVVSELRKRSRRLTKKQLKHVATISANNDKAIGDIIAGVYRDVGKDGVVMVEKSQTSDTGFRTTHGIRLERGYASPMFINDQSRDECVLEGCHVMVCDGEINNILSIEKVLAPIIREGKKLLIVAPCSPHVLNTLAANVMKKGLKVCVVPPPSFGYRQHELMQDLAFAVGATYYSEKTGDDLSLMDEGDLGWADRVVVGRDETVITKGDVDVTERVAELQEAYSLATKRGDKDFIQSRIASLTGGIGVIEVGGYTDLEQKELYDRVDDAVCAVRAAMSEGVLPGGGVTLYNMARSLGSDSVAANILKGALCAPLQQIMENAGEDFDYTMAPDGMGYNLKTGEYGDMIEMGVIDPTRVTIAALQNAVSVAITILSTKAVITLARA